jgi:dipeptidyl-peptidase-4
LAQGDPSTLYWSKQENAYYHLDKGNIVQVTLPDNNRKVLVSQEQLNLKDQPLLISSFSFSADEQKLLLFTNTKKVWRLRTRGDYYLYDIVKETLIQVGKNWTSSSLMFAKLSPDSSRVAFVSENNLFGENLSNGLYQVTKSVI